MTRRPKRPKSVEEIVCRTLCRADADADVGGRCLWETKRKEAKRIIDAMRAAAPDAYDSFVAAAEASTH